MNKIKENLKSFRMKKGLTQAELAERLHVSKQAVSKWETGRSLPDVSLFPEISSVLGMSVDELMNGKKKHYFLVLSLVIATISFMLAIFLTIFTFQDMKFFGGFTLIAIDGYLASWMKWVFLLLSLSLLQITFLLYFFGYYRRIHQIPLRKSIFIGITIFILFHLYAYLTIWLISLGGPYSAKKLIAFLANIALVLLEVATIILLATKIRNAY